MHLDVKDLKRFYYRTRLGEAARRSLRDQVNAIWPEAAGQTVVGFGFALPVLRPFLNEARRVIALMPGPQGVQHWPPGEPNTAVMCEETQWPIDTGMVDRLIVMHGLEPSEQPYSVIAEAWRVLGPGGRALFIVPNRAGLWARRDRTPFGHGRPYSLGQLETLLRLHEFVPDRHVAALFFPPSERRFWLRTGQAWERIGQRISNYYAGGVLMVVARKQIHATRPKGPPVSAKTPLEVLEGIAKPNPKPKPV